MAGCCVRYFGNDVELLLFLTIHELSFTTESQFIKVSSCSHLTDTNFVRFLHFSEHGCCHFSSIKHFTSSLKKLIRNHMNHWNEDNKHDYTILLCWTKWWCVVISANMPCWTHWYCVVSTNSFFFCFFLVS